MPFERPVLIQRTRCALSNVTRVMIGSGPFCTKMINGKTNLPDFDGKEMVSGLGTEFASGNGIQKTFTMKSILFFAVAFTFASSFVQAQHTPSQAALDYVEGFYEGDTVKLKRAIAPNLYKYGYWRNAKSGKYDGEQMTFRQAVDYAKGVMEKKRFAKADAPKTITLLDQEEQVAVLKLTAWWGIDYLLLARHDDRWVIEQVLWQGPLATVKKM